MLPEGFLWFAGALTPVLSNVVICVIIASRHWLGHQWCRCWTNAEQLGGPCPKELRKSGFAMHFKSDLFSSFRLQCLVRGENEKEQSEKV